MTYNSDRFNLDNWKITLPVDSTGGTGGVALEVENLRAYESKYFYDAPDGAMVFAAAVSGATTVGSRYPRSELREMNSDSCAAWKLSTGGTMTATLKIDKIPTLSNGDSGRVSVGQIHGKDNELVRLYWEGGKVCFKNDRAGAGDGEMQFNFKNSKGQEPSIALGEKFSYMIDARGSTLKVDIHADGDVYTSVSKINTIWQSDALYFKAGVYLNTNETQGSGTCQASFYGLDFSHKAGEGLGGLLPSDLTLTGTYGNDDLAGSYTVDDVIFGRDGDDKLTGRDGDDRLYGESGSDTLYGHWDNDTLYGGSGSDTLYGGWGDDVLRGGSGSDKLYGEEGADRFVFKDTDGASSDTILGFSRSQGDKIDIADVLDGVFDPASDAVTEFVRITTSGTNSVLSVDHDGAGAAFGWAQIATISNVTGLTNEDLLVQDGTLIVS